MITPWKIMRPKNNFHGIGACVLLLSATWMLAGGCALNHSKIAEKGAGTSKNLIVARTDYDASPDWNLPIFTGRDF